MVPWGAQLQAIFVVEDKIEEYHETEIIFLAHVIELSIFNSIQ